MSGIKNTTNNTILGIASFGTSVPTSTAQAAVSPVISSGSLTTGILVQPIYTISSGTLYGQIVNSRFNPPDSINFASICGLSVAPSISPSGSGSVTNAYGLYLAPVITTGTIAKAYSLMISNPTGNGGILNNYSAVLGTTSSALVGIGTATPAYTLDINGVLSTHRAFGNGNGLTTNNQVINIAEGCSGFLSGGCVGTNKTMSIQTTVCFNGSTVINQLTCEGGVFDGRYIYLVPSGLDGRVLRYDTNQPFDVVNSYTAFNTETVESNSKGFRGGVFDGRYIYFVPHYTDFGASSGQVTRYDTALSFFSTTSYSVFDTSILDANSSLFSGGVFDGRYVYYIPDTQHILTRYDSMRSFVDSNSYTIFDIRSVTSSQNVCSGGVFDGRYIYITGRGSSTVTRYDTSLSFTAIDSYTVSSTGLPNADTRYSGGVFDGRYVYFVPEQNPTVTRYDTTTSFTASESYTTCSFSSVLGINYGQYRGGVFDGRYVYFVPYRYNDTEGGIPTPVVRYDTTRSFRSAGSFTTLSTYVVNSYSFGFSGGMFDGRYIYFVPGDLFTGIFTRIDAYPGQKATAIGANQAPNGFAVGSYAGETIPAINDLIISGKMLIRSSDVGYSLLLGMDSAGKPTSSFWNVSSDVRIKRNIQDIPDALSVIRSLRPRKFQFCPAYAKEIGIDPEQYAYGFVADEVENVIDGCVLRSKIPSKYDDENGKKAEGKAESNKLKQLDQNNILIYSIQAIKELADREEKLEKQINEL